MTSDPSIVTGDPASALAAYHAEHVVNCTRCPLHSTRTQVVPGNGDPRSRLMFVGEAPGYHEDLQGVPFCGAAGKLLDELLEGIGLTRDEVFVANVLKCRPPGNRNPEPAEIAECQRHLFNQIAIVRPAMICSLGNFATKLLSGRPEGISRVHGCELPITIAGVDLLLYPIYHPAAALYQRATKQVLIDDIARIPDLLGAVKPDTSTGPPPDSGLAQHAGEPQQAPTAEAEDVDETPPMERTPTDEGPAQLDLF